MGDEDQGRCARIARQLGEGLHELLTATQIEAGRWLTYAACAKFAAGEACVREVSMVKLYTAEMVNRVAYDCVQLHGGYGYMREYPIERFARDARLLTIGGGTSEIMREIIAKQLFPDR